MEQTVQVVKNHEDGTGPAFWQGQAETPTLNRETGEGASVGVDIAGSCRWRGDLWKPQERSLVEIRPRESEGVFERQTEERTVISNP
jgi:hypothetical protein